MRESGKWTSGGGDASIPSISKQLVTSNLPTGVIVTITVTTQ